jgi:hypothetical protein
MIQDDDIETFRPQVIARTFCQPGHRLFDIFRTVSVVNS